METKKKSSTKKRLFWGLLLLLGAVVVALYLLLPAAIGVYTVLPGGSAVDSPPPNFAEVTLHTADGVDLAAWYRQPENGAVIILIPGAGNSRESLRPYAGMLARHGYGVLALDLRGHGDSGGRTNLLGWQGTLDVGAAVDFLAGRPEVQAIGGLGISLGGEVLLGAAAEFPQIAAITSDGASRRSTEELLALESERPLVRNFTARVMYATVGLLTGEQPPRPIIESLQAAHSTRFFLIAAGEEDLEVRFNQLFAQVLGNRAELWIVPEVGHTGAFDRYPEQYERRAIEFFDGNLH